MSWKDERIRELQSQLSAAGSISPEKVAGEIQKTGFRCIRCGECCTGEDNSVVLFPFEIRRIIAKTGEQWLEMAGPPSSGEWDCQGSFHTLEWRIKKRGRSCRYYETGSRSCQVYPERPLLCSTYPFYIEDGKLGASECRGLGSGGEMDADEAMELALRLIERYRIEIEEAISLVERYSDFERGMPSPTGTCIVHDSEGEHSIPFSPDLLRRCMVGRDEA